MVDQRSTDTVADFEHLRTPAGVEVYLYRTSRFKSKQVWVELAAHPQDDRASRALLPALLRRGCRSLPSLAAVARRLEELGGAHLGDSLDRTRGRDVLEFRLDFVDGRFLPADEDPQPGMWKLFEELLTEPLLESDGRFSAAVFEQERRQLLHAIEAEYDDKSEYAWQRLREELYLPHPEGLRSTGEPAEVRALEPEAVARCFARLVAGTPARVHAVGDLRFEDLLPWIERLPLRAWEPEPPAEDRAPPPVQVRDLRKVEHDPIEQTRLCVAHRLDLTDLPLPQFDALGLLSSVIGGGMHSRLFRVIREERGLAYQVGGSIDRSNGTFAVSAGIDAVHEEEVVELVEHVLEDLRETGPTQEEWDTARHLAVSRVRALADSAVGLATALAHELHHGRSRSLEEVRRSLEDLPRETGRDAARRVLDRDVTFVLRNEDSP